tara:strand:- start:192 stop:401 length:210 start_codon:yes stop_codon:yes gene_type:complete
MTTESPTHADDPSRGAIIQLFGVILVILGTLDSMLMWRGGFTLNLFYIGLIATGLFLLMIGKIRRRNRA